MRALSPFSCLALLYVGTINKATLRSFGHTKRGWVGRHSRPTQPPKLLSRQMVYTS